MNMIANFVIFIFVVKTVFSDTLIKNTKQNSKVFKTIQPSGIRMCAKYCYQEKRCRSFNFEKISLSCEMLSLEDSTKYVEEKGYFHSEMTQWSSDVMGNCENHTCSSDERCITLQNTATTCVKIGCLGIQYIYDDNSGLCYHIYLQKKTWAAASQHCNSEDGRLIVLNTQAKIDYFPPSKYASSKIYLGLTDSDKEGTFKWVDGSLLVNHKWKTTENQPNDYDGTYPEMSANCVGIFNGYWYDDYCQAKAYYACERPDLSLK